MTYSTRLAVALLGAAAMYGADATITTPPGTSPGTSLDPPSGTLGTSSSTPPGTPMTNPMSTPMGTPMSTPMSTPPDMPAHAPALAPAGLDPGVAWFAPDGDPWRGWPRDDDAQEFDWLQQKNTGYFPGTPWNAAAGHIAAPAQRRTRRPPAGAAPAPVPEPKHYQLLLTGFVLLLLYSGRRVSGPWRLIRVGNKPLGNI